jgi:hypothetical protein
MIDVDGLGGHEGPRVDARVEMRFEYRLTRLESRCEMTR